MTENPFRIQGVVEPPYFTDRAEELTRIVRVLREPAAKLLVYGDRRMGKTSALGVAVRRVAELGGHAFLADLSTASTVVDMTTRILDAATAALGRRWKDTARDLARRVGVSVSLTVDPGTGVLVPNLDVGLRRADVEAQRSTLSRVLDGLEDLAAERGETIGIVLDEFQELHKFGGEEAEWHLRGVIQQHQHVSYVLAGSETQLIRRMLGKGRAFYGLLDRLSFGAIDPDHLSRWIDGRMAAAGVRAAGVGAVCIALAGPRTRDVVRLARKTHDVSAGAGAAGEREVEHAFGELVQEDDDLVRSFWENITPYQQNVLRAVAASERGLTTAETLARFALGSSGTVSNTLRTLVDNGYLIRTDASPGYTFDSPYMRGWVIVHALPDLGLRLPATYRADARGRPGRLTRPSG